MRSRIALLATALAAVPPAGAADQVFHDYAQVIDVDPVVRWQEVPVKRRVCRDRHRRGPAVVGGSVTIDSGAVLSGYALVPDAGKHHPHHHRTCRTVTVYVKERQVDGYRVTYRYHGHEFTMQTDRHPGEQIAIKVKLRPLS